MDRSAPVRGERRRQDERRVPAAPAGSRGPDGGPRCPDRPRGDDGAAPPRPAGGPTATRFSPAATPACRRSDRAYPGDGDGACTGHRKSRAHAHGHDPLRTTSARPRSPPVRDVPGAGGRPGPRGRPVRGRRGADPRRRPGPRRCRPAPARPRERGLWRPAAGRGG